MNSQPTPESQANWSEARLQSECFQWHHNTFRELRGLLFTVDNNATDGIKGSVRKAMGRIAGVSDMLYLLYGKCYCLEFKLKGEKQSLAQRNWQYLVESDGFEYCIIDDYEQFQRVIRDIHSHGTILPF